MRQEEFTHDDCGKCGAASKPYEGIRDQTLRVCPQCGEVWFEDLNDPPYKSPGPKTADLTPHPRSP